MWRKEFGFLYWQSHPFSYDDYSKRPKGFAYQSIISRPAVCVVAIWSYFDSKKEKGWI